MLQEMGGAQASEMALRLAGWRGSGLRSLPGAAPDAVPGPFRAILQAGGTGGETKEVTVVRQPDYMAVHADVSLTEAVSRAVRDTMMASSHIQPDGVSTVRSVGVLTLYQIVRATI